MAARPRQKPAGMAHGVLSALFLGWAGAGMVMGMVTGMATGMVTGAAAEMVKPMPGIDCKRVRLALENGLPFGPGFRRLEVEFPKNSRGIEGQVCRLLTMGTGVHMEGYGIGSLKDMRSKVMGALIAAGLGETPETARFSEKSKSGREVFALYKDNALCVTTIVVGLVNGATPAAAAIKDGKVMLAKVKPHQREWWISVDCFTLPGPARVEANADVGTGVGAEVGTGVGAGVGGNLEGEVSLEAIEELEAAN